jgi:hypothetical protein
LRQSHAEQWAASIKQERAAGIDLLVTPRELLRELTLADPGLTVKDNGRLSRRIAEGGYELFKELLSVDKWPIT